jgi:hypothetical protein
MENIEYYMRHLEYFMYSNWYILAFGNVVVIWSLFPVLVPVYPLNTPYVGRYV